jgi:hypothetical protein
MLLDPLHKVRNAALHYGIQLRVIALCLGGAGAGALSARSLGAWAQGGNTAAASTHEDDVKEAQLHVLGPHHAKRAMEKHGVQQAWRATREVKQRAAQDVTKCASAMQAPASRGEAVRGLAAACKRARMQRATHAERNAQRSTSRTWKSSTSSGPASKMAVFISAPSRVCCAG